MIPLDARPHLTQARLRQRGDRTPLLAPERGLLLGGSAPAILRLVDGRRTVREVIDQLAASHEAPTARIEHDVVGLLEALARRGLVELEGA
ncbi:MAG TPA: pyrroloquinoline quinone biosynthesis peptide chaperone PqqD [Kofleriaceae bacterium]|nr:pyrroloquinoline quinone biosynthesis peptide chaperone PqqD [Kofleriaceae bacterium]